MTGALGAGTVGTPDQIAQAMLLKLSVTDPALSCEIGTPERKIIDAAAESISESTIDNYLLGSGLDIDTKSGVDLENFVGVFGFSRQTGRFSVGNVDFTLSFPATTPVTIPIQSQVYVPASVTGTTDLLYNTLAVSTIAVGTQVITISCQCVLTGAVGNVTSTSITGFIGGFGIASVTNPQPMTGGVDPETDDNLRQRFKRTFLRNIAGTKDFYTALMLQNIYTTQVAVIGPYSYYKEEIQFTGGTTKKYSTNVQIKYVWPSGWFLYQNQGLPNELFYVDGADYTVDTTAFPPAVKPAHPNITAAGAVADFEYQYTSTASRNDPYQNITNKVDVFLNGAQATDVSEQVVSGSTLFTSTSVQSFLRDDLSNVVSGHRFQPLGSVPIITFPGVIYSPTATYVYAVDYIGVNSITLLAGSVKENSGIEWLTSSPPAAGVVLTCTYTYNRIPELMQAIINSQKQITTDVLVHQAKYLNLYLTIIVVYNFNVDVQAVNANIAKVLTTFFTNSGFGAWVQYSDIAQTVHNVIGVDNVRMATSSDMAGTGMPYGVAARFKSVVSQQYTGDFKVPDSSIALFDGVNVVRRASNTF